jgi:hypothetical protein
VFIALKPNGQRANFRHGQAQSGTSGVTGLRLFMQAMDINIGGRRRAIPVR